MNDSSAPRLGETLDAAGARSGEPVELQAAHLTTHGVILGMTGSGKTGLGIVLLEELLSRGIPCLILDPKGDMGNLLLNFPALRVEDFRPWIDEAEARRTNRAIEDVAAATAEKWATGLQSWGVRPDDMRKLGTRAHFTIFTPGSSAGIPLDVVGSLTAPEPSTDLETTADEIEGFTSGLLSLINRDADPISSPDHILISNLISRAWGQRQSLDLPTLVSQIANPPIRKLGVFEIDTFIPPRQRQALAVQLNALLASPSFGPWMRGVPLDMQRMLYDASGRPRAAIVYLAHLSEAERQFIVTLVMSKMVSWMRRQPGTSDLRAMIYMDEVAGFAPPTAQPPSKKPILTILKQARAHGVGMVLSTQNPVDLDYKAMSNAGTWMIGRLQTERDKARVLEGMRSAAGGPDVSTLAEMIGGLGQRQFLLHTSRGGAPVRFTTRWAMSYLRGPLTRVEIERLMADAPERSMQDATAPHEAALASTGDSSTRVDDHRVAVAPSVFPGIRVRYLDPAAPWAREIGADPASSNLQAAVAMRVHLKYDDTAAGIDHDEEYECIFFPLSDAPQPAEATVVDYDERDLKSDPPPGATYRIPNASIHNGIFFRSLEARLKDHLYRTRTTEVFANRALGLYARVGEAEAAFQARCRAAASERADAEAARLRDKVKAKLDRLSGQQRTAEDRVRELTADSRQRVQQEIISGAGQLLNAFLRGRAGLGSLTGAASRRGVTQRTQERLATAKGKLDDVIASITGLEDELPDQLATIQEKWEAQAADVETLAIPLEKNDINIEETVLLWIQTPD